MKHIITWGLLGALFVGMLIFFLSYPAINYGGDLAEYYGMTQSIKEHQSLVLTVEDQAKLEAQGINHVNFIDPQYYITGVDGERYPVHFFLYSVLIVPVRIVLELFGNNPLNTLRIANLIILFTTFIVIFRFFLKNTWQRILLLISVLLSPMVSFIIWPGPDLFFLCLILISLFAFFAKRTLLAAIIISVASWHSQPLIILGGFATLYYFFSNISFARTEDQRTFRVKLAAIPYAAGIGVIMFFPYIFNYLVFGVFSPWVLLKDGWTQIYGFGAQNMSIQKLYEQFFDLNMGLFWYAPMLVLGGIGILFREARAGKWHILGVSLAFLITTFFYQTNPAWHYGTSGFGPSRHILFIIPFFLYLFVHYLYSARKAQGDQEIQTRWLLFGVVTAFVITGFFYQTQAAWHYGTSGFGPSRHILFFLPFLLFLFVRYMTNSKTVMLIIGLFMISQTYIHSWNGFLTPDFRTVLEHNPYAHYVLSHYPAFYNPTPEIFVDRTNHEDLKYPTSAIYKENGICKKAYVLLMEIGKLEKECGFIPNQYKKKLVNPYKQKVNNTRTIKTTEATFWPDEESCYDARYPLPDKPYICMKSIENAMYYTGITDKKRLQKVSDWTGVWKLTWGDPVQITIPPGYTVDHYAFEGIYVNY